MTGIEKPADPRLALQEYLRNKDTSSANATLFTIVDTWAKTNPSEAGAAALTLPTKSERERAIGALLQVWSRSDPRAALAWIRSHPDESPSRRFSTYANLAVQVDLPAVKEAAASAQDAAEKQRLNVIIANQLARSDPDGAIAFLESIPPEDRMSATEVYRGWAERDPAAAVAAYRALHSPEAGARKDKPAVAPQLRYLFDVWIQKDPAAAAAAVLDLHKADPPGLLFEVAQKWCRTDAPAAASWAAALPEGPVRNEVLKQFMSVWSQHDSTVASSFIAALPPGSGKSAAAEAFALAVFEIDPDAALILSRAISERSKRHDVLHQAWASWQRKNPAAANEWFTNSKHLFDSERAAIRQ